MLSNSHGHDHDELFEDHDQTKPTSSIKSFRHETYWKVDLDRGGAFLIKLKESLWECYIYLFIYL